MSKALEPSRRGPNMARTIAACSIGNALEWFDIAIYGYFAVSIAKAVFPNPSMDVSLLLAFGTYAASYVARPLGALVLGSYADRVGRRSSMILSTNVMAAGSLLIALVPPYSQVGVAAPILVVCAKLAQGFSAGGEFGSSTALLIDGRGSRRGFLASWQFASQGLSTLLASAFGWGLNAWLTPAAVDEWGWRLPFLMGSLLGPAGYGLRRLIDDPSAGERRDAPGPAAMLARRHKAALLLALGMLVLSTSLQHVLVYLPTYALRELGIDQRASFLATTVAGVILVGATPVAGWASDRFGRSRLMLLAAVAVMVAAPPSFALLVRHPLPATVVAVAAVLATLKAAYYGPLAAQMAGLFTNDTRSTGLALSYNVGVALFGGFGPAAMMSMKQGFGTSIAPAWYIVATCLVSIAALVASLGAEAHAE